MTQEHGLSGENLSRPNGCHSQPGQVEQLLVERRILWEGQREAWAASDYWRTAFYESQRELRLDSVALNHAAEATRATKALVAGLEQRLAQALDESTERLTQLNVARAGTRALEERVQELTAECDRMRSLVRICQEAVGEGS